MKLVASSAIDVCHFVDGLTGDATGELSLVAHGGERTGSVFVENGRICWAAARGFARRLGDLLASSAKLDKVAMESLYATCQRERLPLGEHLVNEGLVSPAALRAALLEHSTVSLHHLCGHSTVQAEWRARRSGAYSSRFTFSTTEVLARTLAEGHRPLVERAAVELAESFPESFAGSSKDGELGEYGAAFVRSASRSMPDPIAVRGGHLTVERLLRLGTWATSALDVASALHEHSVFFTASVAEGAFSAWRTGAIVFAGFTGARGPARLLHRRAKARRAESHHGDL